MNKKLLSLIAGACLVLSSNVITFAQKMSSDDLYKNAYNSVVQCQSSKTQLSVNEARKSIDLLKGTGASWAIGEFSKQVDQIQHPILVCIVDNILSCQKTPMQEVIESTRELIKYLPNEEWRNSYSSALDKCQQAIYNNAETLVKEFESTKTIESKNLAMIAVNELLKSKNGGVNSLGKSYLNRIDVVKVNFPVEENIIPDEQLKDAVLKELSKVSNKVTVEDALKVKKLDIGSHKVLSLEGLQYFTNLENLNLQKRNLIVTGQEKDAIRDLSNLKGLPNLKVLNVKFQAVEDFTVLETLPKLEIFDGYSQGNGTITSIKLPDFSKCKNIKSLDLCYLDCKDLSFLKGCISLENLGIDSFDNLVDISELKNFKNLKILGIQSCKSIKDFSALESLNSLTNIVMSDTEISDISFLFDQPIKLAGFRNTNVPIEQKLKLKELNPNMYFFDLK